MNWEVIGFLATVVLGVLPLVIPLDRYWEWRRRSAFVLRKRSRQKKWARLEARKAFLTTLRDSAAEQSRYLLQGVLIVVTAVAAATVLGVQMEVTWPQAVPRFTWLCAWCLYFFALYRVGVDRRVRKPVLFKKVIEQIDKQMATLRAAEGRAANK